MTDSTPGLTIGNLVLYEEKILRFREEAIHILHGGGMDKSKLKVV